MKITLPQRKALDNLAAGRSSDHGLRGSSQHGGHSSVMRALINRGWAEWVPDKGYAITEDGKEARKQND